MPVMETKTHQKRDSRASRIPNSRADDEVPLGRRGGDDPPSLGENNHSISKTDYEDGKSWRTILMVPFGRGGPGFSVLDVTNPVILEGAVGADGVTRAAGSGPLHMFSIFNDSYNNEVVRVDHNGSITRIPYTRFSLTIDDTEEAKKAN